VALLRDLTSRVYVIDDDNCLVGVLSLRDLIVAKPDTKIADVMFDEPVTVGVLSDEEEVAQVVARYNLLAVPVVDDDSHLVGIVTVDDAIDTVLPSGWRHRLPRRRTRHTDEREAAPAAVTAASTTSDDGSGAEVGPDDAER
jgi:predicted transcriptional regulator